MKTKALFNYAFDSVRVMNTTLIKGLFFAVSLSILLLLLSLQSAKAFLGGGGPPVYVGPVPNIDYKAGYVLARSVVIDPETGEPILVEFGEDGKEIAPVNIQDYKTSDLIVYPAADYRYQQQRLSSFKEQYEETIAQDAELMTRKEFEQANFLYADNKTSIQQEELKEGINSVLVRAQKGRFVPLDGVDQKPNDILVLLEFDVDLTQPIELTDEHKSLVTNRDGQVIAQSTNTIGYRVGFFGDPTSAEQKRTGRITSEDTVYGPVPFVKVNVDEFAYKGGVSVSGDDGRYSFQFYMGPCPLGGFSYTTDVWAELRYRNFLPTGSPSIPYYLRSPGYSYCFAQLVPAAIAPSVIGIQSTIAIPNIQTNLYADVMFLTGRIALKNSQGQNIPIGDTTYTAFEKPAEYSTQKYYDFNGDEVADHVEQGRLLECTNVEDASDIKPAFLSDSINSGALAGGAGEVLEGYSCTEVNPNPKPEQGGNWQGIFYDGSQDGVEDYPDLVRVIDQEFRNEEIGVLKAISEADIQNTDVYVFRESTGQLILERRGLKPEEAKYRTAIEYDEEENGVAYRIMLRGNRDWGLNVGGGVNRQQSFEDWATEYQLTEPFQSRDADHPRPGEFVKIVAINRATGYTGTSRVQLTGAANNQLLAGLLDVEAPVITLSPPNLKIWAERDYEVEHGLTKGEERNYTVGNEGAALTSDTTIRLYTEWLDEEGKPLPEELGLDNGAQYGLTGRFAKIVGSNQLKGDSVSSDLAEFAIAPGRNTQALRLKGQTKGSEHFYIHVIGKAKEQECVSDSSCPSFDLPSEQPEYQGRPKLLTPFLTPLWDEDKSWQEFRAYRNLIRELEEGLGEGEEIPEDEKPIKPLPAYAWQYRPEYQFSQFEFEIQEIERTFTQEEGSPETADILDLENPTIASSDDYITALYSLLEANFDALNPVDGGQELILALGENEQRVSFGESGEIRFENISSLAALDVEDILSMRLYSNNDAGNILWEFAFEYLSIDTTLLEADEWVGECFPVSADDPTLDLYSAVVGYNQSQASEPHNIRWKVDGPGSLQNSFQRVDQFGFTSNTLTMSREKGSRARVISSIAGDETEAVFEYVCVQAGEPETITVNQEGDAYVSGLGEIVVKVDVKDAWGNPVEDNTAVEFIPTGDILLSNQTSLTHDGKASVSIKGTNNNQASSLLVYVNSELNQQIPIEIKPIDVQINAPVSVAANEKFEVELITTPSIPGLQLMLTGTVGTIEDALIVTDALGTAKTTVWANEQRGTGELHVILDYNAVASSQIEVENEFQVLASPVPVMVGTETEEGVTLITEESGFSYEAYYGASAEVTVFGNPGEEIEVSLGVAHKRVETNELYYPLTYKLGDKVYDEAGRNHALANNVTIVDDSPKFDGRSVEFKETLVLAEKDTYIELKNGENFLFDSNWGLSIDAKFKEQVDKGSVINIGGGVLIEADPQNITVKLVGEAETVEIASTIPDYENWHSIEVERLNSILSLKINSQVVASHNYSGAINFSNTSIELGRDFNGKLAEFRSYRIGSAAKPVAVFDDGSTVKSVVVGDDGEATILVKSTGQMNEHSAAQEVGVVAKGQVLTIALLSMKTHHQLVQSEILSSREYFDGFDRFIASAPAQNSSPVLFGLIGDAYAQTVPSLLYNKQFRDRKRSNFRLPTWISVFGDEQFYKDIGRGLKQFVDDELAGIGEQLEEGFKEIGDAIASGEFSKEDAAILIMRAALAVPLVRRYLSRAFNPTIKFLKRFKGKPIAGHLADTLLRVLKPAIKGDFDPLFAAVYGILFIADMTEVILSDDGSEIIETINLVINGVESAEDLEGIFSFVRQVALSADPSCLQDLNTIDYIETDNTAQFVDFFIGSAHAKGGALTVLKRVNVKPFFKKLRSALNKMDVQEESGAAPKKFRLAKFIADLGTAFSAFDVLDSKGELANEAKEILENILDERILLAGMVIGHRNTPGALKSLVKGDMPLRMRPIELMLSIAQIESSIADGELDGKQYKVDIINEPYRASFEGRQLKWVVRDKYKKVFVDVVAIGDKRNLAGEKPTAYIHVNGLNGEAFHLANIASLLSQGKTIIGIEGQASIQFYQTAPVGKLVLPFGSPLKRRVDIVTGELDSATWWEIKSLAYNRKNAKTGKQLKGISSGLTTLDLKNLSAEFNVKRENVQQVIDEGTLKVKSGQFYSKEFFVDRVFSGVVLDNVPQKMQWVLQSFEKKNMNAFRIQGRTPYVDKGVFLQCGVDKPASKDCKDVYLPGKTNPLDAIREKLVNSVRSPNQKQVEDIIYRTFIQGSFDEKSDVQEYINEFKGIAPSIINSKKAGSWIVQPANASCETSQ